MNKIHVITLLSIILVFTFLGCKKKDETPRDVKVKAKINGELVEFSEFEMTYKATIDNYQYQQIRGTSDKGVYPIKQIYLLVKSPNEGLNELKPNGEYDKVRMYYSSGENHYVAEINTGVAKVNLKYKPNTLVFASGTFSGTVFKDTDSLVITDGTFDFN